MVDVSYGVHVKSNKKSPGSFGGIYGMNHSSDTLNGENGGTLGMVPLGIYWVYPLLKGSLGGLNRVPPKGTSIFPMIQI